VIRTRFLRQLSLAALLSISGLVAACGDSPTEPAPAFGHTDLRAGSGASAESGDTLTVVYTGWLYDASKPDQKGLQFDSNVGGDTFSFELGVGGVIAGWDLGLVGVQAGTVRRLVIPPDLAYGGVRNGPIPPNSTLVFEVEVTAIDEE
jgi:FKBP-type peptidyl-prolyl cis-trans isomerase FkpA